MFTPSPLLFNMQAYPNTIIRNKNQNNGKQHIEIKLVDTFLDLVSQKNKTSLNVNKNQIKKNQSQINILFQNMSLPRNHASGRYFPGHNQKKEEKKSLGQYIDKKKWRFLHQGWLLYKKIEPERYLLRKTRVGINGHGPGCA